MGERAGEESDDGGGYTDHALLAHSYGHPAEDVYAASVDELRRDTGTDSEGLGPVLRDGSDLEEVFLHSDVAGSGSVFAAFQAISADVCGNGNLDGQCPTEKGEGLGALDCPADAQDIPSEADAAAEVAVLGTSSKKFATANAADGAGSARVWA
jgi:hypothetical protein